MSYDKNPRSGSDNTSPEFRVEVWGPDALFTRPEFKGERVSYDVMTPSAARGILEAIFYHPGMKYKIDRIHVCAPIRFASIRRNEIKCKVNSKAVYRAATEGDLTGLYIPAAQEICQRSSLVLKNVRYVIEAHMELTKDHYAHDTLEKFCAMAHRRIRRGQFYHMPWFGIREYAAFFAPCEEIPACPPELKGRQDLGWMLYDMDYSSKDIAPQFFRAVMEDGVINVPDPRSEEVRK